MLPHIVQYVGEQSRYQPQSHRNFQLVLISMSDSVYVYTIVTTATLAKSPVGENHEA